MRRASLVAPLLLIGIGLLFLARNVFPEMQLLDYLAKYWPLLLVVWGGLRLIEILFWAATARPLPRFGISSGEWVLVIFLCFLGVSLHAVRGFSAWLPGSRIELGGLDIFGESYDYPLSAERPATKSSPRDHREFSRQRPHHRRRCPNGESDRPYHHSQPGSGVRRSSQSAGAARN